MSLRFTVLALLGTFTAPAPAAAQDQPLIPLDPPVEGDITVDPTATETPEQREDRIARARVEFDQGTAAYESGDLVGALAHFETTYAMVGSPEVLFNIAVVAERLGNVDRALVAYRVWALSAPPDERPEIERRIARLRTLLRGEPDPEPEEATVPAVEERNPPPSSHTEPDPLPAGPTFVWTWVGLGVAAAAGVASGLFWVDANAADRELATMCPMGCSSETVEASRGPTMVTLTNVFLVTSLVAAAATVAIFFVELAGGGDGEETVALGVGPGSVALRGAW